MQDKSETIREAGGACNTLRRPAFTGGRLPNRIAKDSSRKDPQLDILSDGAERLYWRLILAADDFGRFEADPRIVKADCFPLKVDSLKTATVEKWLDEIEKAGLVQLYSVLNRGYGQFVTFDPPRAAKSKFPAPNDAEESPIENKGDSICKQVKADAPVFDVRSSYSEVRSANASISPHVFEPEDEWLRKFLVDTKLLPFQNGEREALMDPKWWEQLSIACTSIDIPFLESEFAKMGMWLGRNKSRRPTKRFIANWLEKAAERRKDYAR